MRRVRLRGLVAVIVLLFLAGAGTLWATGHAHIAEAPTAAAPTPTPPAETCWSGTLAVQLPDLPEYWWVNYGNKNNSQVQICGVGLRVGDIMSFPDYSAHIARLSDELAQWRDCALDGPPLCPEEYVALKARR